MAIEWKRMYLGSHHGYVDGREVAQVGLVKGPDGKMRGWVAHLVGQTTELPGYHADEAAAKVAAERALLLGG